MNHMIRFVILFMVLPGATSISHAQTYVGENGYVEFISKAPLHTFKGTSEQLQGMIDLDENLIDFYVDLNTLDSGIARRDHDMRNTYLETDKFPFAEFTGEITEGLESITTGDIVTNVTATGIFTMRGIDQEMVVEGTITSSAECFVLEGTWIILLKDFNIERPGILFYELAEEQTVNMKIELKKSGIILR